MASKLSRREFLAKSTVTLVLVPVATSMIGCGDDSGASCPGIDTTSTVTNGHTHTVCVPTADLTNPTGSKTYTTSTDAGHNHTVTLTMQQLTTINGGGSVTVTSSTPAPHNFTIMKM